MCLAWKRVYITYQQRLYYRVYQLPCLVHANQAHDRCQMHIGWTVCTVARKKGSYSYIRISGYMNLTAKFLGWGQGTVLLFDATIQKWHCTLTRPEKIDVQSVFRVYDTKRIALWVSNMFQSFLASLPTQVLYLNTFFHWLFAFFSTQSNC